MANRFFTSQFLAPGDLELDGDEAHHLATVRRLELGESVILFNGDGNEYPATIRHLAKKSVRVTIERVGAVSRESARPITIASAFPKADRFDFLIEKLVELGVTEFIPLITSRSVVTPNESKRDKWERAVIEASKQCGRNRLMAVGSPVEWSKWCASVTGQRVILHPSHQSLQSFASGQSPITIAVGPEGGFSDPEVEQAISNEWTVASLGPRILRIETAALAAATILTSAS